MLKPRTKAIFYSAVLCATLQVNEAQGPFEGETLSLREALDNALLQNRQLQIERINQEVSALALHASYGVYDPIFTSRVHQESATDTGGFDPANFSADAIFSADSEVASLGLIGLLPSGLSYTVGGNYAHSSGSRNFLNFDSYKVGAGVTVEQPLLRNFWIDQPRWQIQVNKRNLRISELGVHFLAMSVINLTQQAYFDLAYAWDNLRIQKSLVSTKQDFLKGIQTQVQLGSLTALEEKLAQSQAAATQTDVITASNSVALASNTLRTMMGITPDQWNQQFLVPSDVLLTFPEHFDLGESWRTGLRQRPDLLQLAINLESADLTVRYRKNQLFPSLNVFGSYGLKGSDAIQTFPTEDPEARSSLAFRELEEQSAPNSTVGILFSLPLTSTAERANYRASKELKKQAELLLKQKEEFILREIADAIDLARFSFNRAEAARQAAQFAGEALQAEEAKLKSGSGSIFLVLQAQTDLATARNSEAIAKRDYNKALSQLYFTEGSLLERIQFDIRFK